MGLMAARESVSTGRSTDSRAGLGVLLAALMAAVVLGATALRDPGSIVGWEAYAIATNVADGYGYCFATDHRWLFDSRDHGAAEPSQRCVPTAWVDPVYTYVLAAIIWAAGSLHLQVGVILNLLLFVAVVVLTFRLASRMEGVVAGYASAALVALMLCISPHWVNTLNNTLMAMLFLLLFAIALQRAMAMPDLRSAALLGVATGAAVLASPGAVTFVPVALLAIVLANWPRWRPAIVGTVTASCLMAVMLTPWALRNLAVLEDFVLVRTGSGQISFVGVVATGATVDPTTIAIDPPYRASSAREAIRLASRDEGRLALEAFQRDYGWALAGEGYRRMTEVQRDKWFQQETWRYLAENPRLSLELGLWKLYGFARIGFPLGTVILGLALLAGLIALLRRRLGLLVMILCIGAYVAPFLLIVPYFPRYRLPAEPMIIIAAVMAVVEIFGLAARRLASESAKDESAR